MWFMFSLDNKEGLYRTNNYGTFFSYSEGFSNQHAAAFVERRVSKEVCILCHLHNNITMLKNTKAQTKRS